MSVIIEIIKARLQHSIDKVPDPGAMAAVEPRDLQTAIIVIEECQAEIKRLHANIESLRPLMAAATPGPWSVEYPGDDEGITIMSENGLDVGVCWSGEEPGLPDAELIVALHACATQLLKDNP